MGFEGIAAREATIEGFGSSRYVKQYRERKHISASKVDEFGSAEYVGTEGNGTVHYSDSGGKAYLAAKGLAYDWIVTLYDINSLTGGMWRPYKRECVKDMERFLKGLPRGFDAEARVIGMQDGQDASGMKSVLAFLGSRGIPVMEIDIFGDEIRHVALDLRRGMTFDILLEDRIYRPGELKNGNTADQFEAMLKGRKP